jgi:hypothetical protein
MALGALGRDILALIVQQGMVPVRALGARTHLETHATAPLARASTTSTLT